MKISFLSQLFLERIPKKDLLRSCCFIFFFLLFLLFIPVGCSQRDMAEYDYKKEEVSESTVDGNFRDQEMGDLVEQNTDELELSSNQSVSQGYLKNDTSGWNNDRKVNKLFSKKAENLKTKETKEQQVEKQREVKRQRVYSGYAKLTVKDIDQVKDDIQKYTEEIEGYVESIYQNTVSIRVPVAKFDDAFKWILTLGKVEDKSIETQDVTEVYGDLRNRLDIAKNSRDRLYLLLTQTADVKERVKILKEIGRLSEEIERMESTFAMLGQLIAFSRISVDLQQYLENQEIKIAEIPFPWIKALSPAYASRRKLLAQVKLDLGDSFAVFKEGNIYNAESSTGIRFRVSTARNHPQGDAVFWQKALAFHLKELYASSEEITLRTSNEKEVCGVLFTSRDSEPFQYFVGVVTENKVLHIIEIFSPKEDRKEFDTLFKVIEEGRIQ